MELFGESPVLATDNDAGVCEMLTVLSVRFGGRWFKLIHGHF